MQTAGGRGTGSAGISLKDSVGRTLQVLCTESELQEDCEIVRVGERVQREGRRWKAAVHGGALDEVEWWFDQYAGIVGYEAAMINGLVTAISAVFATMHEGDDGWAPAPGPARLEPIASTADTRVIEHEIEWDVPGEPVQAGLRVVGGHRVLRDGDQDFSGWLFTLDGARVVPLPPVDTGVD